MTLFCALAIRMDMDVMGLKDSFALDIFMTGLQVLLALLLMAYTYVMGKKALTRLGF